jgi:hypothetical protein
MDINLDILKIANALLKYGTVKRAAKHILCSETFIYTSTKGEWVYFFILEDRMKIGYTANLIARAHSFRLHTGGAGEFGAIIHGSKLIEKKAQRDMEEYHIAGEWFYFDDSKLSICIKELRNAHAD